MGFFEVDQFIMSLLAYVLEKGPVSVDELKTVFGEEGLETTIAMLVDQEYLTRTEDGQIGIGKRGEFILGLRTEGPPAFPKVIAFLWELGEFLLYSRAFWDLISERVNQDEKTGKEFYRIAEEIRHIVESYLSLDPAETPKEEARPEALLLALHTITKFLVSILAPQLVGKTYQEAAAMLSAAGFSLDKMWGDLHGPKEDEKEGD